MAAAPILTNIAAENPRLRHGKAVKTTMTMKKTTTFLTAALAAKLLAVAIVFTSCVSKKQFVNLQKDYATVQSELASLQCVGMTDRQLDRMAMIECLQFTAAAAVISALICLAVILSVEKGLVPWMQSTFEDAADTYYRKLISDIVRLDHVKPFVRTAAAALTAFAAGSITSVIMLRTQNTESLSDQIRGSEMQLDLKKTHLLRRGLIGTGQKK